MPVASVFGSAAIAPADPEYERARRLGELLARAGWTVMTGGYHGAMAATSRGAREAGGHVVGITVSGWFGHTANRWVAEERAAKDMVERLGALVHADAWLAVGGGVGTLSEVSLVWHLLQRGELPPRPLVLVGPLWRALVPVLARELMVEPGDLEHLHLASTPEEACAAIGPAAAVAGS